MIVELKERSEASVIKYFRKAQDAQISKFLPIKAKTVQEALSDYQKTLLPGAASYGRTIYADGVYVGDIWCYSIQKEAPNAMVSYCVFEKDYWGKGIASQALTLFLKEIKNKYSVKNIGAFTFSENLPSVKVLKNVDFQK